MIIKSIINNQWALAPQNVLNMIIIILGNANIVKMKMIIYKNTIGIEYQNIKGFNANMISNVSNRGRRIKKINDKNKKGNSMNKKSKDNNRKENKIKKDKIRYGEYFIY